MTYKLLLDYPSQHSQCAHAAIYDKPEQSSSMLLRFGLGGGAGGMLSYVGSMGVRSSSPPTVEQGLFLSLVLLNTAQQTYAKYSKPSHQLLYTTCACMYVYTSCTHTH